MIEKVLAWPGSALLAGVLLFATVPSAHAQTVDEDDKATTAEPGRLVVPLSGTATVRRNGDLSASPARVDTGLIEIGDARSMSISLSHTGAPGASPVSIGNATLIGKNATEYATSFGGFATLSSGEAIDVVVTFTPATPGTKSAGLQLDIDGATSPYVVLFDGRSRYPLTSDLGISGAKVEFGQAVLEAVSAKTFVLSNLGDTEAPAINVSAATLGGDTPDAFTVDFTPTTLAPGESMTVPVTMSSALEGTKKATLTLTHDGNNPSVETVFEGEVVKPAAVPVNFSKSTLATGGVNVDRGTSIQFGPDGKLYVSEMDGQIRVFDITRNGKNNYSANQTQVIDVIKNVMNHNDNGAENPGLGKRLVTGIHVAGSAGTPVIYAVSSDPRQAAGPSGNDSNLDTNSGILHKLTKNGGGWNKQDLVRGLPRSEENHVGNGLVLVGNKIIVSMGGHTNQGVPSNNFAQLPEYALSSAALEIDLGQIGGGTYDLPTLDDETRAGVNDNNDPFGGNDGKNQAKLVGNGPVKLYATGLRNAYDITLSESGKLYTFDNGPNNGWGGKPGNSCANVTNDGGTTLPDHLHLVTKGSYYGHPNPTRGSKSNTFNPGNPQTPIEIAEHAVECQYKEPGQDGSLTSIQSSTNGLDEYTASNFGGAMKGDLLAVSFNKAIYRLQLNGSGNQVTSKNMLATNTGTAPLDLTTQGDAGPFPGTIWLVDNIEKSIKVFEPADY